MTTSGDLKAAMATLEERLCAARTVKRRKLISATLAFLALGPLPLTLTGHLFWAGIALSCYLLYMLFSPGFCVPSREEVNEVILDLENRKSAGATAVDTSWTTQFGRPARGVATARRRDDLNHQ